MRNTDFSLGSIGKLLLGYLTCVATLLGCEAVVAQEGSLRALEAYAYEPKPDGIEFQKLNPREAPQPGELMLRKGDRLAICGDSITEQKMYSRIMETYLTVCVPDLEVKVRQYGWSGEKTDGFLRRMEQDCLTFEPTIATLSYGMNDARYRPFDVTNGKWYEDHYSAIVRKFKAAGTRVVVGSPGASGRLATWVKSRSGTLDEHNVHLCALRDIAIDVADEYGTGYADVFWPMYKARVFGDQLYSTPNEKYEIAGKDGIHPGWAGQLIMAFAYLRAMGLDGDLGEITIDLEEGTARATGGHKLLSYENGTLELESRRYPFCASGPEDKDDSIRSGMTLVPFNQELNRITLKVEGLESEEAEVLWGEYSGTFTREQLSSGINLAAEFEMNPFSDAFAIVDEAVFAKQAFETTQVKKIFHGSFGKRDFEAAVRSTEKERQPLADAIEEHFEPVIHSIRIRPFE